MTGFIVAAAALTLAALLPLAPALLQRSATPRAWRTLAALALALPLAAGGLYARLGQPQALETRPADPVQRMVARLAERLASAPDDAEGWQLLARSHESLGRPQDALPAYAQLRRLRPGDPAVLSQLAVTLALVRGDGLVGEPQALLQQALRLDPNHVPTLALLGTAAHEGGDTAGAMRYWQRVLDQVPADSDIAASLRDSIAKLQPPGR